MTRELQALVAQLAAKHTILFEQILKDISLLTVQPPVRTVSSNWNAGMSTTAGVYITGRKSCRRPSIQSWDSTAPHKRLDVAMIEPARWRSVRTS